MQAKLLKNIIFIIISATLSGCQTSWNQDYVPIEFEAEGRNIYAYGDIDSDVIPRFLDVYNDNPEAEVLVLEMVGGSVDDEVNLKFSQMIRDLGLSTHVPSNGLVASGGTDLFLAGSHRTLEPGACVGVHAWATDDYEANDIARDDPVHQEYLRYFRKMGINEYFYWFTLAAASAQDMHWMSAQDVNRFSMTTDKPAPELGTKDVCDNRF